MPDIDPSIATFFVYSTVVLLQSRVLYALYDLSRQYNHPRLSKCMLSTYASLKVPFELSGDLH